MNSKFASPDDGDDKQIFLGRYFSTPQNIFDLDLVEACINPFAFNRLLNIPFDNIRDLTLWLQREGLLRIHVFCTRCPARVSLNNRKSNRDGCSYRCGGLKKHEITVREGTLFKAFRYSLPDVLCFMRSYLMGLTIQRCSKEVRISYNTTGIKWALLIRNVMQEVIWREYFSKTSKYQLPGPVQIDEKLFGKKRKHNRGEEVGLHVWVLGILCITTLRMILLPVDTRRVLLSIVCYIMFLFNFLLFSIYLLSHNCVCVNLFLLLYRYV